ncbi:MAG: AraC family transcriptional regulator [Verrucomicrobiales bacterium]|nr:AraC family transcriptional regulator [Verrucomicrobiales bacterium]
MRPSVESVVPSPNQSFTCLDLDLPEFHNDYHKHPELELTRIVENSGKRLIGDSLERFEAGDLVLIGSGLPHQYESDRVGRSRAKVIQFSPGLFGKDFYLMPEFRRIGDLQTRAAPGLVFSSGISGKVTSLINQLFADQNEAKRALLLLEILLVLSEDRESRSLASLGYHNQVSEKSVDRLGRMIAFIDQQVDRGEPVTLEEMARVAALHPQSVSRFFHQHTGMNFQAYLQVIRVGKAARRLMETDDPISAIALDIGFASQSNFNRQFREIHKMTPSLYRKAVSPTAQRESPS